MARISGFAGGISGKIGSVVFSQRQGQTIARQYQPVVSNPNTRGQQDARVAFKLMTQLGAIMAPAMGSFIIKMRPEKKGKTSQRNAFFTKNYPLVEVAETEQGTRALIAMDKLQLTDSFIAAGSLNVAQSAENILLDGAASPGQRVKVVVVGYGTPASIDNPAKIILIDEADVAVDGVWRYSFNSSLLSTMGVGIEFTVLSYGMIPISERIRSRMEEIHTPTDERYFSAVELQNFVSNGEMQVTETIGTNFRIASNKSNGEMQVTETIDDDPSINT